jgi:hypothetical protein
VAWTYTTDMSKSISPFKKRDKVEQYDKLVKMGWHGSGDL